MTDTSTLSARFPTATAADWRALVEKTLKGEPLESLNKATAEGLPIAPFYEEGAGPGLAFPPRPHDAERPWDIRAEIAHPDPARASADLLKDLEGGAASAVIRIDPTGERGVAVGSADGLTLVLQGVVPEFAPIGLDAGFLGPKAADWLGAVAKASPAAKLNFNLDPLSAFAEAGVSPGPIESHLVSAATVAIRLADTYPQAQLFLASGRVVHEAGGGEAQEVAFAAAAAVAYAKALVRAGLTIPDAFARITLGLSVDADYFLTIAKLRAARVVFARIAQACGADTTARIEVRSSRRMLTAKDAWTNMIRLSAAGVGAAVGGADAVILGTFTDAIGHPTAFARRQSRNAQLVLMEEAHLGRVVDPGAGSGYVEALTDEIARAAWAGFQNIEGLTGGLVGELRSGDFSNVVHDRVRDRGDLKIVGVTAFPPVQEAPVEVEHVVAKSVEAPSSRLPGPDSHCKAYPPVRLAEAYEGAQ